jgi:hypothetical protein
VHPAAPGLALLASCALVNALVGGAFRTVVALVGLAGSSWLFWRAYSPERFFRSPS